MSVRTTIEASPQVFARAGGALYLTLIVLGGYFQVAIGKVVVSGDAAATAANLSGMESLWRIGITCELVALICVTTLAMIYFFLLRPVSKELNVLATFLRLVGIAIESMATLSLVAALFPVAGAAYLKAFTPDQLHALAYLGIRLHAHAFALALLFFGSCFLVHGYLIFKAGYLPKALGILIQIAGAAYLTNSLALFVAPGFQALIFPAILLPAFVAETSLSIWLLLKGVNLEKWREATARTAIA